MTTEILLVCNDKKLTVSLYFKASLEELIIITLPSFTVRVFMFYQNLFVCAACILFDGILSVMCIKSLLHESLTHITHIIG